MGGHYEELSPLQAKIPIDIRQIFDAWRVASAQYQANYVGGMRWKNVNGSDYLIKTLNRTGGMKGLGPRSPTTETVLQEFQVGKTRTIERLKVLSARI